MILCNKKYIFFILFSVTLFAADSNDKHTELENSHIVAHDKIVNAYRHYCHRKNIRNIHKTWKHLREFYPDSFNEQFSDFQSKFDCFKIFDDRKDSDPYSKRFVSQTIKDAIVKKKLIEIQKQCNPNYRNNIYDITIDKDGDLFFSDFSQRYGLKHEDEDIVRVKVKYRDKNFNALKNSDGSYILVEKL